MDSKRRTTLLLALVACFASSSLGASDCEDLIARHMTGQAMLAAQFVAVAEKAGMTPPQINTVLKGVAETSAMKSFGSPTRTGTHT